MTYKIGIGIATFGSDDWYKIGQETLAHTLDTVNNLEEVEVIHHHGDTLGQARDEVVELLDAEFIILLDADDRLDENYVTYAAAYLNQLPPNVILQPSTYGWYGGNQYDEEPWLIPPRDLYQSNFLVIGSVFPKSFYRSFDHALEASEDWDMFSRMVDAGCKIVPASHMIYIVNVRPGEISRSGDKIRVDRAASIIRLVNRTRNLNNYLL